eukprot:1539034-Rhodomonas_salina.1
MVLRRHSRIAGGVRCTRYWDRVGCSDCEVLSGCARCGTESGAGVHSAVLSQGRVCTGRVRELAHAEPQRGPDREAHVHRGRMLLPRPQYCVQ